MDIEQNLTKTVQCQLKRTIIVFNKCVIAGLRKHNDLYKHKPQEAILNP